MRKSMKLKKRYEITSRGFKLLNQYCPGLVRGKALTALVNALQPFATIWFSAQIINEISTAQRINLIILYVSAVILINFAISVIRSMFEKVSAEKENMMWCWFSKLISDKQMSMDYVDIESAEIKQQKKKVEENIFWYGNGLAQLVWGTSTLVNVAVNLILSVSMTVTLFTSRSGDPIVDNPIWVIIILALIVLGGFISSKANIKENDIFKKWCDRTTWYNRNFHVFGYNICLNLNYAMDLRIYEQYRITNRKLDDMISYEKGDHPYTVPMALYPSLARILIGIVYACSYVFVVTKAFLGAFGVGSIVQYVGVLSQFSSGVQDLMYVFADNETYCGYLQMLYDYLDIPNKKYQGTLPVEKRAFCDDGDFDYEIEFRNVTFKYPGTDVPALDNVSMKFRIGERLAVVGMNGSGKTTFIKLLCRLYDPDEGEILLNGVNIKKYNYEEYMMLFSVVFQDFQLFSFPLGENVAANMEYDREKVVECLEKAGFGERLRTLEHGIGTHLYKDFEESGVSISGGEAQKIALARALYKTAPFIIQCLYVHIGLLSSIFLFEK